MNLKVLKMIVATLAVLGCIGCICTLVYFSCYTSILDIPAHAAEVESEGAVKSIDLVELQSTIQELSAQVEILQQERDTAVADLEVIQNKFTNCNAKLLAYSIQNGLLTTFNEYLAYQNEELTDENEHLKAESNYVYNKDWSYEYTKKDIELLANVMYYENYSTGRWEMMLTGSVVLNRVLSDKYPNTVKEVLYQVDGKYKQYSTTKYFYTKEIPSECYKLAEILLKYGPVAPPEVLYQAHFNQGKVFWEWKGEEFCYKSK